MTQPASRSYYVLGPRPATTLADRVPRPATEAEWYAQSFEAVIGDRWTVAKTECQIDTSTDVWTVVGSFLGLATNVDARLFRVEVLRNGQQVGQESAETWDHTSALVDQFTEYIAQFLSAGVTPSFDFVKEKTTPEPKQVTVEDYQKVVARVKRLVALAGRALNPNEAERKLAAQKTADYLAAHPTPLRWLVKPGTTVRVVETKHLHTGLGRAKQHLRTTKARGSNWFFESQRVQGTQAVEALRAGWLQFERHGYTVFVPAGDVEVHL